MGRRPRRHRRARQNAAHGSCSGGLCPQHPPPGAGPQHPLQLVAGPPDVLGVRPICAIDTRVIAADFFLAAAHEGVTLIEPFGGMCSGLEMLLRNGIPVKRYLYCDKSTSCQRVAQHRVAELAGRYPAVFSLDTARDMFTVPQDVRRLDAAALVATGARDGSQWVMVAGWECQDLSMAGTAKGMQGPRSNTFFDMVNTPGALQQLQTDRPPAYLLENTYMNHSKGSVRDVDYPLICRTIGSPIVLDAAQCGSRAHRMRCYWTNLADANLLQHVFQHAVRRASDLYIDDILDPGRVAAPVVKNDTAPRYVCNKGSPDQPGRRQALPTFVTAVNSRGFRPGTAGSVYVAGSNPPRLASPPEPNPDEHERALGYSTGATAAPGITPIQRHQITGGCMDANALEHMCAVSLFLCRHLHPEAHACAAAAAAPPVVAAPSAFPASFVGARNHTETAVQLALAAVAATTDPSPDVWEDASAMAFIKERKAPANATDAERRRLQRRARAYTWQAGTLHRRVGRQHHPGGASPL